MTDALPLFPPDPPDLGATLTTLVDAYGYETVDLELRRHEPTVVVPSAPARWTDPETSHGAAKTEPDVGRFGTKSQQARLLRSFARSPKTDQEATADVVGMLANPSRFDGCRRRCSDLRAVHYLSDSGDRRKNPGSDDDSVVWQITEAGKTAITHLDDTGWSRP